MLRGTEASAENAYKFRSLNLIHLFRNLGIYLLFYGADRLYLNPETIQTEIT